MMNTTNTPPTAVITPTLPTSPLSSSSSSIIPLANRLSKLTTLPFGRTKWQHRFFILLDSELRTYKDEFADTPCDILSLHRIKTALPLAIGPQAYCLRLEPDMPHYKALTLACPSQHSRDAWSNAIHLRLERRKQPINSSMVHSKGSPPSLSRRRGIMLAPLTIWNESGLVVDDRDNDFDDDSDGTTLTGALGFSSSSSSSCSSTPSPPSYVYERSMSVPTVITSSPEQQQDGETSPSFLKYKQQFHLY